MQYKVFISFMSPGVTRGRPLSSSSFCIRYRRCVIDHCSLSPILHVRGTTLYNLIHGRVLYNLLSVRCGMVYSLVLIRDRVMYNLKFVRDRVM